MANEILKIDVGGVAYNVRDDRVITLADNGTITAGTWKAKATPTLTAYTDGQLFLYKITVAGASTTTLNIDNLGAKTIYRQGTTALTTQFAVGNYLLLAYNSTNTCFRVVNFYDSDSNTYTTAYCSTAASTAAKVAQQTSYNLLANSYNVITFTASNTVASALTLNINSKGAKPIYINGTASSSSNYTLPAGVYIFYYNGTNYYFRTDGRLPVAGTDKVALASDIGNGTITINQGGTQKGTFTVNQSGNTTIDLDAGGTGSVGTLNTTATTAQSTSSSESFSGNITLHKVSKTGTYSDLINKPVDVNSSSLSSDFNNLTSNGVYRVMSSYQSTNAPSTFTGNKTGWLFVSQIMGTSLLDQELHFEDKVYIRKRSGSWGSWTEVGGGGGSSDSTNLKVMYTGTISLSPNEQKFITIRPKDMLSSTTYTFVDFEYLIIRDELRDIEWYIPKHQLVQASVLYEMETQGYSISTGLSNPLLIVESSPVSFNTSVYSSSVYTSAGYVSGQLSEEYQLVVDETAGNTYPSIQIGFIGRAYNSLTQQSTDSGVDY